jgi:uncharacterized protein (DUF927 family)
MIVGVLAVIIGFISFKMSQLERLCSSIEKCFVIMMAIWTALALFSSVWNGFNKGIVQLDSRNNDIETTFDVMEATEESQIFEEDWF